MRVLQICKRLGLSSCLIVLTGLSCCSPSRGLSQDKNPDKISLTPLLPKAGVRLRVSDSFSQIVEVTYSGRGKSKSRRWVSGFETEFVEEIQETSTDDWATSVVREYQSVVSRESTRTKTIEEARVELVRKADGSYSCRMLDGSEPPPLLHEVLRVQRSPVLPFEGGLSLLPRDPLSVGDAWEIAPEEAARLVGHPPDLIGKGPKARGHLTSVKRIGGKSKLGYTLELDLELSRYRPLDDQVTLSQPVRCKARFDWSRFAGQDSAEGSLDQRSSYVGSGVGKGRASAVSIDFNVTVRRRLRVTVDRVLAQSPGLQHEPVTDTELRGVHLRPSGFGCTLTAPGPAWVWYRRSGSSSEAVDYICWSPARTAYVGFQRVADQVAGGLSMDSAETAARGFLQGLQREGVSASLESLGPADSPIRGRSFRAVYSVTSTNETSKAYTYFVVTNDGVLVTLSTRGSKEPDEFSRLVRSLRTSRQQ